MFDEVIQVQVTIGISFYKDGEIVKDWVNSADRKLRAGKYNGKNCVVT